jgi:hypothetical protein
MQALQLQTSDIIHFNPAITEHELARDRASESNLPAKPRLATLRPDVSGIGVALSGYLGILSVGPRSDKLALMRTLIQHHRATTEERGCEENIGCPSDVQLLAFAHYFVSNRSFFRDVVQTAGSCQSEKTDVSRVLIQRIEGLPSSARVLSMDAANAVLKGWVGSTRDSMHEQCSFEIVFEDGLRYLGHYLFAASKAPPSLSRHVRKQLTGLAAITDEKKRALGTDDSVIGLIGASLARAARIALHRYEI